MDPGAGNADGDGRPRNVLVKSRDIVRRPGNNEFLAMEDRAMYEEQCWSIFSPRWVRNGIEKKTLLLHDTHAEEALQLLQGKAKEWERVYDDTKRRQKGYQDKEVQVRMVPTPPVHVPRKQKLLDQQEGTVGRR